MTTNTPSPALPSNVEELREALERIRRTPAKPFPDPGAHSARAFGDAVWRAWSDIQRIATEALAATSYSPLRASTPTEKEALEKLVDDYGGADTSEGLFLSSLVASLRGLPGPTPAEVVNDLFGEVAILRNALREIVSWSDSGSPPKSLTDACQVGEDAFHRIACGTISRARSLQKRPVAFRVQDAKASSGYMLFYDERDASRFAEEHACEYQGLYARDGSPAHGEGELAHAVLAETVRGFIEEHANGHLRMGEFCPVCLASTPKASDHAPARAESVTRQDSLTEAGNG